MRQTRDEYTRNILDTIRNIQEGKTNTSSKSFINEETEKKDNGNKKQNAIAITDDPKFGQNALSNQIEQFRSSVEGGAQFSKPSEDNVAESPLIYMPDEKNLVFSGVIPCLNNLKFQFVLKTSTGNGCFIWSNGMILSKDNMSILNKLYGFYSNWKEQWQTAGSDLEKMAENLKNN